MPKQSFLLVSLQEDKAKKLAQAVSNESCRKILDFLTEKEATESELAKKLNLPMPTVHYNLKQLVDARLVSADEFHYSKKGREVSHYRLANKYIIIAPKSTFGIKEKLKSILPAALIVAAAGFLFKFVSGHSIQQAAKSEPLVQRASIAGMPQQALASSNAAGADWTSMISANSNYLWFGAGLALMVIVYIIVEYVNYRKKIKE